MLAIRAATRATYQQRPKRTERSPSIDIVFEGDTRTAGHAHRARVTTLGLHVPNRCRAGAYEYKHKLSLSVTLHRH